MKYYKVLNRNMKSPVKGMKYELRKTYTEPNFDKSNICCSRGLYYLKLWQVSGWLKSNSRLFEVKVKGDIKEFKDKSRCSKLKLVKEVYWRDFVKDCLRNIDNILKYRKDKYLKYWFIGAIMDSLIYLLRGTGNKDKIDFLRNCDKSLYGMYKKECFFPSDFTLAEIRDILYLILKTVER